MKRKPQIFSFLLPLCLVAPVPFCPPAYVYLSTYSNSTASIKGPVSEFLLHFCIYVGSVLAESNGENNSSGLPLVYFKQ